MTEKIDESQIVLEEVETKIKKNSNGTKTNIYLNFNLDHEDIDVEFLKKIIKFHGVKGYMSPSNGSTSFWTTTLDNKNILVNIDHKLKDTDVLFCFRLYLYSGDVYQLNGMEHSNTCGGYVRIEFLKNGKAKIISNTKYKSRWFEKNMDNEEEFQNFLQNLPEKVKENRINIRNIIDANDKILGQKDEYTHDEILEIFDKISYDPESKNTKLN